QVYMEYNIRSNDNDVNDIILTSLKDLDNIFFVEHSDSENEKDNEKLDNEELKYGLEECVHGNTSRAPKNMNRIELSYDIACDVYQFLKNYSNIYGMPSPGRHFSKISMPIVFIPTSYTYASVYHDYVRAYKDKHGEDTRVIAEFIFINIWKALILSLQFMSPKFDLCETCETMKIDIQHATQYEKKVELTESYIAHLNRAQQERDYYNNNIISAVEDGKRNPNLTEAPILFKTFDEDEYKSNTIHSFIFDVNTLLPIISTRPLSLKRQEELYKEIVPYVDIPFCDITCPKPNRIDENLSET
ncbi:9137_t:CDS:2, partial [Scutellospora calospora]